MARLLAPTAAAHRTDPRRGGRRIARRIAVLGVAAVLALAAVPSARAQSLPFDVSAATITTTAPISSYIATSLADLSSGDRDKVVAARAALLVPLDARRAGGQPSDVFLAAYSRLLAEQLLPVATGKDPHAKLNLAIVVVRAGEVGRSPALAPLVAALETDASPVISAYGLRAAGNVIVYALGSPAAAAADPMTPAVIKAVQQHADSDMVAMESYLAFTKLLNEQAAANAIGASTLNNATPRIIDAIHELMDVRLKQFAAADIVEPAAESPAFTYLTNRGWGTSTPAQKQRSIELITQVMDAAATQLQSLAAGGAATNRVKQQALQNMIKAAAQGLNVVASQTNNQPLTAVTTQIRGFGAATPATDYKAAVGKTIEAARKSFPAAPAGGAPAATRPAGQ